jgi:EmrB/QacA subfamily drug resistance transporter
MSDPANRKTALLIAALSSFLIPFMASSVNIALPSIGKELKVNAVLLSWIATSYLLSSAVFLVPFGKIADMRGRKKVLLCGASVYTLSSLLLAVSPSALMLIAFRIVQGIGAAMIFGTAVAILTSVFPVEDRGKALGLNVTATYLGYSVGPFLGGFLTYHLGWRSIFFSCVPLGILIVSLIVFRLKGEWAEAKGEKYDLPGAVVYGLTLVAIIYGFSLLPGIRGAGLILIGLIGIGIFIKWETKVENPVLSLALFRSNRAFAFSNLAALINYSATFASTFLLSLYLQYIKGINAKDAGFILVSQPIIQAILSPYAGRLSDKVEPRIVSSIGMAVTVVGMLFFVFLNEKTSLAVIIVGLVLLGAGLALFSSPNINAVMSSVEKKFYGLASATLGTMRLVGQTLSMATLTLIFTVSIGKAQITPEYYPLFLKGVRVAFVIFAVLSFAAIFASLARGKVREPRQRDSGIQREDWRLKS